MLTIRPIETQIFSTSIDVESTHQRTVSTSLPTVADL
jgi:hypothetical protein